MNEKEKTKEQQSQYNAYLRLATLFGEMKKGYHSVESSKLEISKINTEFGTVHSFTDDELKRAMTPDYDDIESSSSSY